MRIGDRVFVVSPREVMIDETRPWLIEIGNDVQIASGVSIITHGYEWSVLKGVYGDVLGSAGKVTIGNNVFIGVNTIILKGVTIGDNTIIGASSVVSHDLPGNCVAVGNPAKAVMSLEEYYKRRVSAQYQEARECVLNYREVYGKEADESVLSEFFWLFTGDDQNLFPCWEEKMKLIGNREKSGQVLRERKPMFESKEDFLKSIK